MDTTRLLVLLAAPAVAVIDSFIAIVAVPVIQSQLHATDAGAQLVIAGYGLAYAALLVAGGRLGDRYGHRRLLVMGMVMFGVTSLFAGAAQGEVALIVARFAQGGAAALMYPQALGQLQMLFRGRHRGIAMGAYGATLGLAAVAAPVAGGLPIEADLLGLGWRPIFLLNVPLCASAALLAARVLPSRGRVQTGPGVSVEAIGLALLTLGLLGLILPLIVGRQLGWPWWTWPPVGGGLVAAVTLVIREQRAHSPLFDTGLFQLRAFRIGLLVTTTFYAGQLSYLVLLTLYLQHGLLLSPMATGLMVMSVAAGFSVASVAAPWLQARVGRHVAISGSLTLTLATSGLVLVVLAHRSGPAAALPPLLFVAGAGFGLVIPALVKTALHGVPRENAGSAAGVLVTTQQIGGALGVAVDGIVFFSLLHVVSVAVAYGTALGLDVVLFAATAVLLQVIRGER